MRTSQARTPSLRRHSPSGQGVVTLSGHDHCLGPWPRLCRKPPAETQAAYDRIIAEWLANGRRPLHSLEDAPALSVNELILAFWTHAEAHYRHDDGTPTNELSEYRYALRPLRELYGLTAAARFSPLKLKAVRQRMIEASWCRSRINKQVRRIVGLFRWGVSEELVPEATYRSLSTVSGLERGRTEARESDPVLPVPDDHVTAVLPHVLPTVAAMIQLQRLTGAPRRGVSVTRLRGGHDWHRVALPAHKAQDEESRQGPCDRPRAEGTGDPTALSSRSLS
jgi:hypothetical protein